MQHYIRVVLATFVAAVAVGCAAPQGPHVRVAHASAAEMNAHKDAKVVWYEFQKGDVVPMKFALIGMVQAEGPNDMKLVATRPFYVVTFKDGRTMFSFDGKKLVAEPFAKWAMLVGPGEQRGETAFLLYVGRRDEMPEQLR